MAQSLVKSGHAASLFLIRILIFTIQKFKNLTLMAKPEPNKDQVTDAVTQSNVKVVAEAPATAMGNVYQATAQALSNAAHDATTSQEQSNVTAQAATTQGVTTLYSIDTASTGKATQEILKGKDPE